MSRSAPQLWHGRRVTAANYRRLHRRRTRGDRRLFRFLGLVAARQAGLVGAAGIIGIGVVRLPTNLGG